ncbi:cryptochrome/photolyase family protein [Glaciecola petra]|uniref:Deoxyribodipyrimidine photo-lyase n=1 Tax=Glaciecola petra TaxID=3075602 RepID=A0ABU2ZP82_9ALTE|nr:deoxyribodipyrimidine photo-lyase [Aestuariibacter sp. P117]MDT0594231.1 deoxyribodipyrimidine photo-lyase [Aestuariibacter sp. P117]
MTQALVWFRQDLRIKDNPALANANQIGNVLPVYIFDDTVPEEGSMGGASRWFLHHALESLNKALDNKLLIFKGDPKEIIPSLCKSAQCQHVFWNRMYEPWAISRDSIIKTTLKSMDINATSSNGSLLWEPMSVLKKDGTPYKVYTPFYKNGCLKQAPPRYPVNTHHTKFAESSVEFPDLARLTISDLQLLPKIKWDEKFYEMWDVSENGAQDKLAHFITSSIDNYDEQRNIPSVEGTSLLSPYLHFGLISPNQTWYAVVDAFEGIDSAKERKGVGVYLSELGWREFSYYLLFHFNHIQRENFNSKFNIFPWKNDTQSKQDLTAWQTGNTGIPIVDAGMRELYKTGYMHNRVRMIVGSFLVKNLLIDWRRGERWFWDCLVDADTASNAAGWQWVAGSGADAAPFFRIFNPILQGEKFDKQGEYVKTYCPELSNLPNKYIHKPWDAPPIILAEAGITLGEDYPHPIADLSATRKRALDAYSSIKKAV